MKANTQGAGPLLTQACIVPRWTTTSPGLLTAVELEVALARQQQGVVDRLGPVHEFWRAGCEFGDADDRALPGADIVVAGDESLPLSSIGSVGIVRGHPLCRPALAPGDVRSPQPADGGEPLVGLDHGFAVRVVPSDDAPHFHSHVCPPSMILRSSGYSPDDRPCYSSGMASAESIDNRLIAQHPQEKKEASAASAMLRCRQHAGVGNSYSFGWECSVAAGGVSRKQGSRRTDRTWRFPASGIPGYFPDRGLNREISADLAAEFPGSLTEVPGSAGIGN